MSTDFGDLLDRAAAGEQAALSELLALLTQAVARLEVVVDELNARANEAPVEPESA